MVQMLEVYSHITVCRENTDWGVWPSGDPPSPTPPIRSPPELTDPERHLGPNLNFRAEPGGEKLDIVAGGTTKAAHARTANWFKVEHDGVEGWISAHYIHGHGDCG